MSQPKNAMEIFKILEKSNCRECGEKTCLAFAGTVYQGRKQLDRCPRIDEEIIKVYAHYTDTDPSIDVEAADYLLFTGVIVKGKLTYDNTQHPIELETKNINTKMVDRVHTTEYPYRMIDSGIYVGNRKELAYFPLPPREELRNKYYRWWRSANS